MGQMGGQELADFLDRALVYVPPKTHSLTPKGFTDPGLRTPDLEQAACLVGPRRL